MTEQTPPPAPPAPKSDEPTLAGAVALINVLSQRVTVLEQTLHALATTAGRVVPSDAVDAFIKDHAP
jgi:hypothetical protein